MSDAPEVIECDQGSWEWRQARTGVITASMFAEVRKRVGGLDERQQAYVAAVRSGKDRKEAAKEVGYKSTPSAQKKGTSRRLSISEIRPATLVRTARPSARECGRSAPRRRVAP